MLLGPLVFCKRSFVRAITKMSHFEVHFWSFTSFSKNIYNVSFTNVAWTPFVQCWYRSKKVQQNDPHHLQKHNILVSIFLMTRPKYFWRVCKYILMCLELKFLQERIIIFYTDNLVEKNWGKYFLISCTYWWNDAIDLKDDLLV